MNINNLNPCNADEHEIAVIGSMLQMPEGLDRYKHLVDPEDFADEKLGRLFIAIQTLIEAGKPVGNLRYLKTALGAMRGCDNLADYDFIRGLIKSVANGSHGVYHAEHVRAAANKRRLLAIVQDMAKRVQDSTSTSEDDYTALQAALRNLDRNVQTKTPRTLYEIGKELVQDLRQPKTGEIKKPGIMTGLSGFDSSLGAIIPGDLMIIAARPGCGKTAFAMQFAQRAANRRKNVLFVSLEMKDRQLLGRLLVPLSGVASETLRSMSPNPSEVDAIAEAVEEFNGVPIRVIDDRRMTVQKLRTILRYEQQTNGVDALFLDYLQLVKPEKEQFKTPKHEQIAFVSAELKTIAGEFEIPVVCLAQLNREADGQRPMLSNLKDSGAIEQDADQVLFIHHTEESKGQEKRSVELIVAKNRHGETGTANIFWVPSETRFTESIEWRG